MQYHVPTKQFTVSANDLEYAAMCLLCAIKHIRIQSGLPLTRYKRDGALSPADHAQKTIIEAANKLGIDLGGQWGNELDVSGDDI